MIVTVGISAVLAAILNLQFPIGLRVLAECSDSTSFFLRGFTHWTAIRDIVLPLASENPSGIWAFLSLQYRGDTRSLSKNLWPNEKEGYNLAKLSMGDFGPQSKGRVWG